jgi:broad specificity phosphatase PhoE
LYPVSITYTLYRIDLPNKVQLLPSFKTTNQQPLTALGVLQAKELGRTSSWLHNNVNHFHRIFSSDLDRSKHTTALVLSELQSATAAATTRATRGENKEPFHKECLQSFVEYTPELRELAQGPRQGFPKRCSVDSAIEMRRQLSMTEPFPLLETEDDGWNRISQWLGRQIRTTAMDISKTTTGTATMATMAHVLAFGHGGIFRVFLTRLIGREILLEHPNATFDPDGRFAVPNTSLTILDIHVDHSEETETLDKRIRKVDVILLTSTEHCSVLS